jgi:TonB family protein
MLAFLLMAPFLILVLVPNPSLAAESDGPGGQEKGLPQYKLPGPLHPSNSCQDQAPDKAPANTHVVPLDLSAGVGYWQVAPDKTGTQNPAPAAPNDTPATQYPRDNKVFTFAEQPPRFPGGERELNKFILVNLRYPPEAMKKGETGLVIVQFIVDRNGKILEPTIVKSVGKEIDKEALRLVKSLPDFEPAKQNGIPVEFRYTLPIRYEMARPAPASGKAPPTPAKPSRKQ